MNQRGRNSTNPPRREKSLPIAPAGDPEVTAFDYQDVPEENRDEVHAIVGRIRKSLRRLLESAVAIGRDLSRARDLVGHGNFLAWLKREFPGSERSAQNYMDLARHFDGITAQFADLNLTAAKALIATSTPAVVRDELFARAGAGETITSEEVRKRIAQAKEAGQKLTEKAGEIASDRAGDTEVDPSAELPSGGAQTIGHAIIRHPVPPPTSVTPAEQLAEALLNLSFDIRKNNRRHGPPGVSVDDRRCGPYDVAMVLMEPEHRDRMYEFHKFAEYVQDVSRALFGMQASPELVKLERQLKQ